MSVNMFFWSLLFHLSVDVYSFTQDKFSCLNKKTWIRTLQKSEEGFAVCRKNKKP